jgi:hypothetical protein
MRGDQNPTRRTRQNQESLGEVPTAGRSADPILATVITKDSYTYSIKILRQEKIIRDHAAGVRLARE